MSSTKVTLRKRELPSGTITLYLDFYPPITNLRTMEKTRREYLGIYLTKNPSTSIEKKANADKLQIAEGIRAQRELSILNQQYGFIDKTMGKADFNSYIQDESLRHNERWLITAKHFAKFSHNNCLFRDITVEYCNKFRDYLLSDEVSISVNSASAYWCTFRSMISTLYKRKLLAENINEFLETIETYTPQKEFLTIDEVRKLYETPCKNDIVKRASLFSCLTGLRKSDILTLRWEHIEAFPNGGLCIRKRTEKTKADMLNPISQEAYELCGEPSVGPIFNVTYDEIRRGIKKWLADAGIKKHITFHCFRHTYATLLITNGNDVYTVSKMLTHRNVATTQIYAHMVDDKKRIAAESIKIKVENP